MCGIVGYIGKENALDIIIEGLKHLEYRGYDSAGVAFVEKKKIKKIREKGKVDLLKKSIEETKIKVHSAIGHTRWATHGSPTKENTHPHSDCKNRIAIVHNGIIENYLELKRMLKEKKHRFSSETDTEVIVHLLEENLKHYPIFDSILNTINMLKGSFALLFIFADYPELMIGVRKNSPLIFAEKDNNFYFSSDIIGISSYVDKAYFLDDETIVFLNNSKYSFFDFKGAERKISPKKVEKSSFFIEKKGYKHFMLKEIFEQPEAIRETIQDRYSIERGEIDVGIDENLFENVEKIKILSCGTSYHAGLIGRFYFEDFSGIETSVSLSSEFFYRDLKESESTLFIAISQSGETADTLKSIRKIKGKNKIISITNVSESSITRESDAFILTHCGPEISVAATKTFTSQISVLFLLALNIAQKTGYLKKEKIISYLEELRKIPIQMEEILNKSESIEKIAYKYYQKESFLYIGRWINYPVALEGSLKLKEISYIFSEAYAGGQLKHGPISLIDEGTPLIAVAPDDRARNNILSNIEEAKTRGAEIISIGSRDDSELLSVSDKMFTISSVNEFLSPLLTTIYTQLFAYYIALRRGVDIDQPRNLAKSVTVE